MAGTDWRLKGNWLKNCSCAFGCPCDFNARPTQGWCRGLVAMDVKEGHFGDVNLDGVKFVATVDFPGPLHEGHGTLQPIIDAGTTEAQREALFGIMSGQNSAEGTMFQIIAAITEKMLDPIVAPISMSFDLDKRRAQVDIPGVLSTRVVPIRNPVTGAEHRIRVVMPEGFEHTVAEVACASISSTGGIRFEVAEGHSSLAVVEQTPRGVAA